MKKAIVTILVFFSVATSVLAQSLTPEEARAIAKDAYVYGFPLVDSYRVQYSYFVDRSSPEYKGAWNEIHNTARVYTPDDKATQTPNSDTPYSFVGADLRTEPLVLTVPTIDAGRYYSLQFIDMYTFNLAYVGSRTTGNEAGKFLLTGPHWNREKPNGIKEVIQSDTDFDFVLYGIKEVIRSDTDFDFVLFCTQLFSPADIDNVRRIQAAYRVETLSQFLARTAPRPAPVIDFPKPLTPDQERNSLDFFKLLNFVLQFCPTVPAEKETMARFAKINVGAGNNFDAGSLSAEMRQALQSGVDDAWKAFAQYKQAKVDTGLVTTVNDGSLGHMDGEDYMRRMAQAVVGIYGNSKEEAIYPAYFVDADGQKLDGSHRYTLRFEPGQLPPVDAFWSLTMYELPGSLLYANPLNRYLINSPMLPSLKRDPDGGITLYFQHDSPGSDKEFNWLPSPSGPFFVATRLYWPKPAAYDGEWKNPPMRRVN